MSSIERRVDWQGVKKCLADIHQTSPEFLRRSVVIGGGACWFYRVQLEKNADPDFPFPIREATANDPWLSKDLDFTGIFRGDAYKLLPAFVETSTEGQRFLAVNGVRLGFAQVGVTFDPAEVFARARIAQFKSAQTHIEFLVIDPVSLYREKQALAQKRNQPNDHAHLETLNRYVAWEFVTTAERYAKNSNSELAQRQESIAFLLDVRDRALEITNLPNVRERIRALITQNTAEAAFIRELLS